MCTEGSAHGLGSTRKELSVAGRPCGDTGGSGRALLPQLPGDFPGGAVVKNPPASAGDTGSIAGPGRSHMPWSS